MFFDGSLGVVFEPFFDEFFNNFLVVCVGDADQEFECITDSWIDVKKSLLHISVFTVAVIHVDMFLSE